MDYYSTELYLCPRVHFLGYRSCTEGVGFEPTRPCDLALFKSARFDHSRTPPLLLYHVSRRLAMLQLYPCPPSAGAHTSTNISSVALIGFGRSASLLSLSRSPQLF